MTQPKKQTPKAEQRGTVPKPGSYTVAGHPSGIANCSEAIRDQLHTVGVGDSVDLVLTTAQAKDLANQGIVQ